MAGKEQFLSQKYEKWSKFEVREGFWDPAKVSGGCANAIAVVNRRLLGPQIDSDSDDEGAAVPRVPTQFDVEGDGA